MTSMRIGKLEKEVVNLRSESEQLKVRLKEKDEEWMALKLQVTQLERVVEGKDEIINTIFHELRDIAQWRQEHDRTLDELSKNKRKFLLEETNPHNSKFIQIGSRFRKTTGGSWDVLCCQHPIEKN
ncbi:unnamed protein product [Sphagnum balticum]